MSVSLLAVRVPWRSAVHMHTTHTAAGRAGPTAVAVLAAGPGPSARWRTGPRGERRGCGVRIACGCGVGRRLCTALIVPWRACFPSCSKITDTGAMKVNPLPHM